jgi:hypothetical protein
MKIVHTDKEHVILCGDFNENPDDENLVQILYDNDHEKVLMNPFQQLFSTRNYSTFHYKSGLLYDQIIMSRSFLIIRRWLFRMHIYLILKKSAAGPEILKDDLSELMPVPGIWEDIAIIFRFL